MAMQALRIPPQRIVIDPALLSIRGGTAYNGVLFQVRWWWEPGPRIRRGRRRT